MQIFHRTKTGDNDAIVLPDAAPARREITIPEAGSIPTQREAPDDLSVILPGVGEPVDEAPPAPVPEPAPAPAGSLPHRMRMGFRRWRRTRPFWGGFWTVLAGFQIAYGPATAFKLMFITNSVWIGVSVGVFVFAMGLLVWATPRQHQLYGVVIVIASLVSLFTSDLGGFLLGMLLGMVGGSMSFAWMPIADKKPKQHRHRGERRTHQASRVLTG